MHCRVEILAVSFLLIFGLTCCAQTPSLTDLSPPISPEFTSRSRYQSEVGTRGMVASDDGEASKWGAEILRQGGNAVDAAVATAFTLAVTRPHYAALGGGGFLIYCPASRKEHSTACYALDYREQAPSSAHREMYIREGKANTRLSQNGALAIGVPGTPAGLLTALEKFGTVSRKKLLSRPIEIAKKGYLFTGYSEKVAFERWTSMNPTAKKIFGCLSTVEKDLTTFKPCAPGTLIQQPDLARVLKRISEQGMSGFYSGETAQQITAGIQKAGGILTLEDLQNYRPVWRQPLRGQWDRYEVISMPPPSSGGLILLQLIHYAEMARSKGAFRLGFGSSESLNALIRGMSLAFEDRATYLGDPDFVKIPLSTLLSPDYLEKRGQNRQPPLSPHTTHFSVIDREGNAVALTTTLNTDFGSGFVPPGTGIVMNNEMDDFSIEPGVPNYFGLVGSEANSISAKKRPLSSMCPTILKENGQVRFVIGAAGGPKIPTSVFLSLWNRIRFGMPLKDAVIAPRIHHQWKPDQVLFEKYGFSLEVQENLKKKGFFIEEVPTLGKVHALEHFPDGRTHGVADPRGEGSVVSE
jgi:gamma-glutamyltranspeptidase / glutathione hydrolase